MGFGEIAPRSEHVLPEVCCRKKNKLYMATPKKVKTQDHDKIQAWAQKHGGVPTVIEQKEDGFHPQPLEIYFNQDNTDVTFDRKQVSWESFFTIMNNRGFAMIYEENGEDPHYHEFVPEGA